MATPLVTIPYVLPLTTQRHAKVAELERAFSMILLSLPEAFYRNLTNFANKNIVYSYHS